MRSRASVRRYQPPSIRGQRTWLIVEAFTDPLNTEGLLEGMSGRCWAKILKKEGASQTRCSGRETQAAVTWPPMVQTADQNSLRLSCRPAPRWIIATLAAVARSPIFRRGIGESHDHTGREVGPESARFKRLRQAAILRVRQFVASRRVFEWRYHNEERVPSNGPLRPRAI